MGLSKEMGTRFGRLSASALNIKPAAMHGGVGLNSLQKKFLESYGLSLDCREIFRKGLHLLKTEKVDLVMGNHPRQNKTTEKLEKVQRGESILDAEEWIRFLEKTESGLDEMLKKEI